MNVEGGTLSKFPTFKQLASWTLFCDFLIIGYVSGYRTDAK